MKLIAEAAGLDQLFFLRSFNSEKTRLKMNLSPQQLIDDRYEIIERLGQGGMGEVWKALDLQLGDEVVLKLPLRHSDPVLLKRFGAEAHLMRKHSNGSSNILDIQGVGDIDGTPYYVMRFLSGGSLEDRCPLVNGQSDVATIEFETNKFEWLLSIGKALDYLHSKGVLHRDVKPANILFNESGDGYLADFGIAKNPTEVTNFTQDPTAPGSSPGTFGYMAPEVLDPDPDVPIGGPADQYALAVTLHESIVGRRPYDATNLIKLFRQTQEGCTPLRDTFPTLPKAASEAVMRALSSSPRQRFENCRSFADEFLNGLRNPVSIPLATPVVTGRGSDNDETREVDLEKYREELRHQKRKDERGGGSVSGGGLGFRPPAGSGGRHAGNPVVTKGGSGISGQKLAGLLGACCLGILGLGLYSFGILGGNNVPVAKSASANSSSSSLDSVPEAVSVRSKIDKSAADFTNDVGMAFRLIPSGSFMGSPADEPDREDDELQHEVVISSDFYLGVTEVTQGQWKSVMGTEPWKGEDFVKEGKDYAASYVSWDDAVKFCEKLGVRDGVKYRLPTEAEWEYACRGGSETKFSFGSKDSNLGDYAWFKDNALDVDEDYAHEVGLKLGNGFGLHDMHGNVWEWCSDGYGSDYYGASPRTDPQGPDDDAYRVVRGGSWSISAQSCRSAHRNGFSPDFRSDYLGFRVLRSSIK